jgi:O-antigen/teichoic acid export membrane protein
MSLGFAGRVDQAGLFAIGLRFSATGSMLLSSLNLNFAPMISAYQGARQMEQLKSVFVQVSRIHCLLLSAWVCGAIVFGKDLLALFGPNFTDGYLVVVLLSAALLPIGLTGPVTILMTMTGHASVTLVNSLLNLALLGVLLLLLVSPYGAMGAALAAAVTAFLFQGYQAFSAWRIHGFTAVSRANNLLAGVVVAGGCLVAWARGGSGLWFPLLGYALVMLIALRALTSHQEREMLRNLLAFRRIQASEG